jgi:drug/metabolite transporter (DMT)-like permease
VAIAVANASLFLAIQHLPVAVAMVLQSLAPAFVISWLALSGRRRPGIRMLIGTAAALVGVALVVQLPTTAPGRINVVGVLFGLATALGVAAFSVLGERATKSYGAIHGNAIAFTVATIFWVMVQAPRGVPELLRQEQLFGQVAVVGVLGTLAPFVLFAWGTARVGPESGSLGISLEPIFSAVIAWIWLGQALGLLQIVGMICIIGGIVYIQHHAPAAIDQGRRPGGPPLVTRLGLRGCEAASNGMPTRPPRQTAGHHAGTCRRKRLAEGRAADSVMRSASPRSAGGRGRLPWAWCTVCGATGWTRSDRLRRW